MEKRFSRRQFLLGATAAGVSAGMGLTECMISSAFAATENVEQTAGEYVSEVSDGAVLNQLEPMTAEQYNKKWSFEIPPTPIDESVISEIVEVDVVVVGAGTSGLVAANSCLDEGLDVCVVTASSIPIFRGGSNHAVMSKAKKAKGVPKLDPMLFEREIINNGVLVDQKKWYRFYNHSEEAMDWLIDIMEAKGYETSLENSPQLLENSDYFSAIGAHGFMTADSHSTGMNQQFVVNELAARLEEAGKKVYYKHVGRQLVRGDVPNGTEGRVNAIIAEREDGTFVKFVGRTAVVLATGDFSQDRDMMMKYAPYTAQVISDEEFDAPVDYDKCFEYGGIYPGDGQKMGLWIGAAWQRIWPNCPMGGAVSVGPANRVLSFSGLKINKFGLRFSNEYGMRDMAGYANRNETGGEVYAIWNADYATKFPFPWINGSVPYGEDNTIPVEDVIAGWEGNVEKGQFVKADTVEDLIKALELPDITLDTVSRYNELCQTGIDEDFHKDPRFLISLEEGPFYGAKGAPSPFLAILGGLRTNEEMQVCDEADNPIEGLYNVGTMVGDMYGVNYSFQIPGLNLGATCVTFPYLLGKFLAQQ